MQPRAIAPALLVAVGGVLGGAGVGGGILRALGVGGQGAAGWAYVLVPAAAALAACDWLFLRWRGRASPFVASAPAVGETTWLLTSAVAGTGVGVYSGALLKWDNAHASTIVGYCVFLPCVLLTVGLSGPIGRALLRIAVVTLCAQESAQAAWSLSRTREYARRGDVTEITLIFGACAAVAALALARWREPIVTRLARLRRTDSAADGPPSRA